MNVCSLVRWRHQFYLFGDSYTKLLAANSVCVFSIVFSLFHTRSAMSLYCGRRMRRDANCNGIIRAFTFLSQVFMCAFRKKDSSVREAVLHQ